MKRIISVVSVIIFIAINYCLAEDAIGFRSMNDSRQPSYLQDEIYRAVVGNMNDNEVFIEKINAIYISDEYLEELEFNSQANIYFGYNREVLEQQFQGERFVFTIENNETVVKPWEKYQNPLETIIKDASIGTGVFLISVTGTVLFSASPLSIIFACSAAVSGESLKQLVIGTVTGAAIEYFKTGDPQKALAAAAIKGDTSFKLTAIGGKIGRTVGSLCGVNLSGLSIKEAADVQKDSSYPVSIIKEFQSVDEYHIYKNAGLYSEYVGNETGLIRNIDWNQKDEQGKTNLERVTEGKNPLNPDGIEYGLYYVGGKDDPIVAVLTQAEHDGEGEFGKLHEDLRGVETNMGMISDSRKNQFWQELAMLRMDS